MEETKHWENLKSGDIQALQELYNHHISGLYKYGMVLCHDEDKVKDAIHDMFLSFWNNRSGLSVPASGKAYLMVSLRRRIFDKGQRVIWRLYHLKTDTWMTGSRPITKYNG